MFLCFRPNGWYLLLLCWGASLWLIFILFFFVYIFVCKLGKRVYLGRGHFSLKMSITLALFTLEETMRNWTSEHRASRCFFHASVGACLAQFLLFYWVSFIVFVMLFPNGNVSTVLLNSPLNIYWRDALAWIRVWLKNNWLGSFAYILL